MLELLELRQDEELLTRAMKVVRQRSQVVVLPKVVLFVACCAQLLWPMVVGILLIANLSTLESIHDTILDRDLAIVEGC